MRNGKSTRIRMAVRGVADGPFTVNCDVSREGAVALIGPETASHAVAAETQAARKTAG